MIRISAVIRPCAMLLVAMISIAGPCVQSAAAAETIAVDVATRYQTMTGWEAHARSWEIDKVDNTYDPSWRTHAPAVAERMVNELGINRIQVPIRSGWENPVDYWTKYVNRQIAYAEMKSHWYEKVNDNGNPAVVNPSGFQFAEFDFRVETSVLPMKQLLEARGEKLYVNLGFVDFGAVAGYLRGNLEFAQNAAEYAEFVQVFFDRLKTKYGITADALEIVNEPENTDQWRGAQIGQALVAASNRLQGAGYGNVNYIAPSVSSAGNALPYMKSLATVPGALARLKTLSYHRYGKTDFAALRTYAQSNNLQTDMSEFINATVDHLIEDLTVANVSAWQKWAIASRKGANPQAFYYLVDLPNPAGPAIKMAPNTAHMAQYFRYVRLGAVRVAAQSSVASRLPVAFVNADGNYVVVVKTNIRAGREPVTITGLRPGTYGVRTTNYGEQVSDLPDVVAAADGSLTMTIAEGFTTIFGKGSSPPR